MADNTTLPTGSGGDVIATDDIAGVKFQRVKLIHGADGVNAGDVATGNPLPVVQTGANVAPLNLVGGGVEAAALRVTIASDSTGVLSVDDNGASITVDAPVGTPAFVRLSDGAAAISTLPVSLASVPSHAVTNAGTFAVQVDGSALTSLQLIDDTIIADDAAFTVGATKVSAVGFLADETATDSVDEGDIGAARMTLDRKQHVAAELETSSMRASGTARVPKFAVISGATSGNNTLVAAAGASLKIRVLSLYLVSAGTVGVKFQSGASGTDLSGLMSFIANTGIALPFNPLGHFETAANTLLNMNLNAAIQVSGGITYIEAT